MAFRFEQLEVTAEHPFYIQGKGWNAAVNLKVGDVLLLYNGTTLVVKTLDTSVRVDAVYNFTVANLHNYFVGKDGVVAHNIKCKFTPKMLSNTEEIARGTGIDKLQVLIEKFGGKAKNWIKKKGWDENGQEWHWYENTRDNVGRVGVKRAGEHDPF